jgi:hypothetical protein
VQETFKAKGGLKAVKREAKKQKSRIKYPLRTPRKDIKYWMIAPILKGKRNKEWSNIVVLYGPKNRAQIAFSFLTKIWV